MQQVCDMVEMLGKVRRRELEGRGSKWKGSQET